MTENEWVKTHTTGPFKKYDPDVVAFIGEILYDRRNQEDDLRSFFRAGYCYHFARMLQDVFKRGDAPCDRTLRPHRMGRYQ